MKIGTCRAHDRPYCDECQDAARQDAIAREEKRREAAQVIGLGLDPVLIAWEPRSRQRNNAWDAEWPIPLWLLTPEELEMIPDGTPLFSIMTDRKVKGVDKIDGDTRFGMTAWGLMDSQLPPRRVSSGGEVDQ